MLLQQAGNSKMRWIFKKLRNQTKDYFFNFLYMPSKALKPEIKTASNRSEQVTPLCSILKIKGEVSTEMWKWILCDLPEKQKRLSTAEKCPTSQFCFQI